MRKFIDSREPETVLTLDNLKQIYNDEKCYGEVENCTFEEFLESWLQFNGKEI